MHGTISVLVVCAVPLMASFACSSGPDLDTLSEQANTVADAAGLEVSGERVVRDSTSRLFEDNEPYVELDTLGQGTIDEVVDAIEASGEAEGFRVSETEQGADQIYITMVGNGVRIVSEVRTSTSAPIPVRVAAAPAD